MKILISTILLTLSLAGSAQAAAPHLTPVSPKAHAAHTMTQSIAQWALQCGNGDCDVLAEVGSGKPFVWSAFWRVSDHDVRQQIKFGPGYCNVTNFQVYYPNTSGTIYDKPTWRSKCT